MPSSFFANTKHQLSLFTKEIFIMRLRIPSETTVVKIVGGLLLLTAFVIAQKMDRNIDSLTSTQITMIPAHQSTR